MGLRSRLQRPRQPPPPPETPPPTPAASDAPTPSQPTFPSPSEPVQSSPAPSAERPVAPLSAMYGTTTPFPKRPSTISRASSQASRASLRTARARIRRVFRRKPNILPSADPAYDVPDTISEEDQHEEIGARSPSVTVRFPVQPAGTDVEWVVDFVDRGVDVEGGRRVTDGFVSFVVPFGWVASRVCDCFCLFKDLAVGFVRATKANAAAGALLETGRLQVVAEVKAVSSPIFVGRGGKVIQVRYASFAGAGIGIAKLCLGGEEEGACVFALCGPKEDEPMILRTMNDISNTIKLIAAPKTEDDQPDGRLDLSTPTPTVSCDRRNPVEKPVEEKPPDAGCSVM